MTASTDRRIPDSAYCFSSREIRAGTEVSSSGCDSRSLMVSLTDGGWYNYGSKMKKRGKSTLEREKGEGVPGVAKETATNAKEVE